MPIVWQLIVHVFSTICTSQFTKQSLKRRTVPLKEIYQLFYLFFDVQLRYIWRYALNLWDVKFSTHWTKMLCWCIDMRLFQPAGSDVYSEWDLKLMKHEGREYKTETYFDSEMTAEKSQMPVGCWHSSFKLCVVESGFTRKWSCTIPYTCDTGNSVLLHPWHTHFFETWLLSMLYLRPPPKPV